MRLGKYTSVRILLTVSFSVCSVALLQWYSIWNRGYTGGGFQRNFIAAPLISSKSTDLKFNSFYIAGLTRDKIYLGNHTAPLTLKIVDWDLTTEVLKKINVQPPVLQGSIRLRVDSPSYYLLNGQAPGIYIGTIGNTNASALPNDDLYFKDCVPIDSGSFVLKSESAVTHRDILIAKKNTSFRVDTTFLERQIDGVFCTDGMLHYSRSLAKMVYIYFYRNQYILSDPDLRNIQRFNTIDTTSHARIKITKVSANGTMTMAAPPVIVNRRSYISDHWLFIQSGLLADGEDPNDLQHYGVIDVYDLTTHKYTFSFYLPFEKGNQLTSFSVFQNRIAAIYGNHLFTYEIRPDAF